MRGFLFLLSLLAVGACAPSAGSETKSPQQIRSDAENAFGELRLKSGTCSAVYLGNERDVQNLWQKGKGGHFVLTAAHCLAGIEDTAIHSLTITWPKLGTSSQVASVASRGDANTWEDYAVLSIGSPPSGLRAFHPALFRNEALGWGGLQLTGLHLATPWTGQKLFLLASRDRKLLRTPCEVSDGNVNGKGFLMKCDMTPEEATGLSGGLLVTDRGDPVGVFKNTINGSEKIYGAHALAWGGLSHMYWPAWMWWDNWWRPQIPTLDQTKCRPRLAKALGLYPDPSQAEVDTFLDKNADLAMQKCEIWTQEKFLGKSNGELCGFQGMKGLRQWEQMRNVLGQPNRRDCSLPVGAPCVVAPDSPRCNQTTLKCVVGEGGCCEPIGSGGGGLDLVGDDWQPSDRATAP